MDNKSLSHTKWKCQYHIVFIPKYRKKILYGRVKNDVREIISTLCKYKDVDNIVGAVCVDHIHLSVAIPPKISISNFMGYLKGKSTLMLYDRHPELQSKWDKAFWARGYYVETIGNITDEAVQKYIKDKNLTEKNFAFFYYEPETQKTYIYNGESYFTAASTIKVPLAMIYYDKINNGDFNSDSTIQYMEGNYEEGSGTTATLYKVGDDVPLSYLLEQMIVNSDNTATNILKTGLGGEKAYRILIKQYTKEELPAEFNEQNITSANYSLDILKKLYENPEKYQALIELMKKSSGGGYLKKNITTCEIAHKYGSYEGNIHDYGICYAKQKYLIGIFTKKVPDAEDLIANINKDILESQK